MIIFGCCCNFVKNIFLFGKKNKWVNLLFRPWLRLLDWGNREWKSDSVENDPMSSEIDGDSELDLQDVEREEEEEQEEEKGKEEEQEKWWRRKTQKYGEEIRKFRGEDEEEEEA